MGRPPAVQADEVCRLIALHPEPVVTAGDLYNDMDMTREGARARLDSLVDDGYLNAKIAGSSAKVYWLTDKGKAALG